MFFMYITHAPLPQFSIQRERKHISLWTMPNLQWRYFKNFQLPSPMLTLSCYCKKHSPYTKQWTEAAEGRCETKKLMTPNQAESNGWVGARQSKQHPNDSSYVFLNCRIVCGKSIKINYPTPRGAIAGEEVAKNENFLPWSIASKWVMNSLKWHGKFCVLHDEFPIRGNIQINRATLSVVVCPRIIFPQNFPPRFPFLS